MIPKCRIMYFIIYYIAYFIVLYQEKLQLKLVESLYVSGVPSSTVKHPAWQEF